MFLLISSSFTSDGKSFHTADANKYDTVQMMDPMHATKPVIYELRQFQLNCVLDNFHNFDRSFLNVEDFRPPRITIIYPHFEEVRGGIDS